MKLKLLSLIVLISVALLVASLINFTQAQVDLDYVVIGGEIEPIKKAPSPTPTVLTALIITAIAAVSAVVVYKLTK